MVLAIQVRTSRALNPLMQALPATGMQVFTSLVAQTGSRSKVSPESEKKDSEAKPKAPRRRVVRHWYTKYLNWQNGIIALIGLGVLVIIAVKYQQQNRKETQPIHSADQIGGYRLQNLMMTGQTSQVWEVVEMASSRHFAIKLLLPEKLVDPEHHRLLIHEAEVGMELAHPNIIKIMKVVKDPANPYFIMEFFPAGNLKLRIMHKKWDFIHEKAHEIFKQVATALAYMNASGWVHRDVKPDNIMVNSSGEVRIIDFALAERVSTRRFFRRRKGRAAGTRSYMSPEQIRGAALDGRADIYSFGVSMYEVLTGRPPFRAETPTALLNKHFIEKPLSPQIYNPDITDTCAQMILRMLSKKKEDRPRDFHEVLMQLRNIQLYKADKPQPTKK
jgi:eukaryotic-like serine/threonine-protein kinase